MERCSVDCKGGKDIFSRRNVAYIQKEYNFIVIGRRGCSGETIRWDGRLINKKATLSLRRSFQNTIDAGKKTLSIEWLLSMVIAYLGME